ncbi:MAG: hypothetical protein AAF430_18185 [Myxococcota bacterium]
MTIHGLELPPLLIALESAGRWVHPGDDALAAAFPELRGDPVDFLSFEDMGRESRPRDAIEILRLCRGSNDGRRDLPWLDTEQSLFLAVNRHPGDDVAIALDYRTSPSDPRVVVSGWPPSDQDGTCAWTEKFVSFAAFAAALDL